MFERSYVLRSFSLDHGVFLTRDINAAVAECDDERAPASVACMTSDGNRLHILIEKWRDVGDRQQDPAGAVDATAAVRKPRRKSKAENNDTRAASGVEPEGVTLPLE